VRPETHAAPPAPRRPYARPRVVVYGTLSDVTLTEVEVNPRNDMFGNFKTI
jgi:hypothetical protein